MSLSQPIGEALTPRRTQLLAPLLLVAGLLLCIGAAAYGFIESQRMEQVLIAVRDVPYGRQLVADDLAIIELPLHRPVQLAGIADSAAVIGQYATRQIGANDLVQPAMLASAPPDRPVYPNGRELGRDMVPVPFALTTLGPITDRDRINIGFTTTDASLCDRDAADVTPGTVLAPPAAAPLDDPAAQRALPRAFACRFMSSIPILYIDDGTAYLEMTPAQAHAMWALTAAGVAMWGERYGSMSAPLMDLDRLDAAQVTLPDLTLPVTQTLRVERSRAQPASGAPPARLPGADTHIPGATPAH